MCWKTKRLAVDGTHVAYVDEGDPAAEPVVLLHGYLGSHLAWRHHIEALSRAHRVIALDWLGWGESGRDPRLRYDYDTEVARLARVLVALDIETCTLCGHDYGGFLGLGYCLRYPRRVRRLALLNTRAQGTFTPRWRAVFGLTSLAARAPATRTLLAKLPLGALHRRLMRPAVDRGIFDERSLDSYVGWMSTDPQGGAFYSRFFNQYRVGVRPELRLGLPTIGCPTAVIWGKRDPYIDSTVALELERKIPGARLTLIPDAGHFIMEERPAEVLAALEVLLATDAV